MKISILMVNWNGERLLSECLQSLQQKISAPFEVIVVDNGSSDGSRQILAQRFPWVKLICSSENLGFTGGNNLAARHATGEVLFLLNLDTVLLVDPSPTAELLIQDRTVGCVGARMCNGSGAVVPNCGHFPSPLRMLLFSSYFWGPYKGPCGPPALNAQRVDWVEASWLLIRRDIWNELGGFDEEIFMYGEDVDLCRRIADLGLRVVQTSALAYRHYTGWSVHSLPYCYAGFRLFHRKHSGRLRRTIAELILYSGLKFRRFVYGLLGLITRQPSFKERTLALRRVDDLWHELSKPGFRLL